VRESSRGSVDVNEWSASAGSSPRWSIDGATEIKTRHRVFFGLRRATTEHWLLRKINYLGQRTHWRVRNGGCRILRRLDWCR
jgi:hypothetical protein